MLYRILSTILFLSLLPLYAIFRTFNGKYIYGWKEKLGKFDAPDLGDKVIMFHGVSVGEVIALENLYTRVIAYCYTSAEYTAEECARALEKDAFVRLTEIPKFVADRDFLREGTYPTRRWRDEDFAPRW